MLVFFDNKIVYSGNKKEHKQHLSLVLMYEFGRHIIEYLGHITSKAGVVVDQEKVKAMVKWPQPLNFRVL